MFYEYSGGIVNIKNYNFLTKIPVFSSLKISLLPSVSNAIQGTPAAAASNKVNA